MKNIMEKHQKEDRVSTYPDELSDYMVNEILENPQATVNDKITGGVGKYGLDPTNPIPIFGIPNNQIYLNRLRLIDEKEISWRRVGSIVVKDINYPVDEYEVFDISGDRITTLYLSSYHLRTSCKAPEGFILIDS